MFQALAIADAFRSEWPLLIVCPSSMRFSWKTSILKWMPNFPEDEIHVITGGSNEFPEFQLLGIILGMIHLLENILFEKFTCSKKNIFRIQVGKK